ncbi:hypothetical protein FRUB_00052 [Fimbriiglobus ruber]|uniref:Uncharacterized protein n=1 Tax=Fimbriiglobus ruber TaxID=1908690 RepID=A0A225DZE7_9BACT|nr:hypothetical protein FRUB_00052 [Fimbriiglobus ruber]
MGKYRVGCEDGRPIFEPAGFRATRKSTCELLSQRGFVF